MRTMKVARSQVLQVRLPLIKPYILSFTTLTEFKACFVVIETENENVGIGEATALTGYADGTHDEIFKMLEQASSKMIDLDAEKAGRIVDNMFKKHPFAASALGAALDLAFDPPKIPDAITCPVLATVSAGLSLDKLLEEVETAVRSGFQTIKVKIGRDINNDLMSASALLDSQFNVSYRFDANQGYSYKDAVRFLQKLEEQNFEKVELVEQPLLPDRWGEMERLCKLTRIPLMLDESIYDKEDIKRARDVGASFIKLKLFKTKGITDLIEKSIFAHNLGLKVVMGNGVATDVANLAEAIAFSSNPKVFWGAFEGTGFAKTESPLLKNTIKLVNGNAIWRKKLPLFDTVLL